MTENYPNRPGHRGIDTSVEAADSIAPLAGPIRARVLAVIAEAGPGGATGDDIGAALDLLVFQVRARTSELRAAGKIVDSGKRRIGVSGRRAIVWVLPVHMTIPSTDQAA